MKLPSLTTIGTKFVEYERYLVHKQGVKAHILHISFVLMAVCSMSAAAVIAGGIGFLLIMAILNWPKVFFMLVGGFIVVGLYDLYLFTKGKNDE